LAAGGAGSYARSSPQSPPATHRRRSRDCRPGWSRLRRSEFEFVIDIGLPPMLYLVQLARTRPFFPFLFSCLDLLPGRVVVLRHEQHVVVVLCLLFQGIVCSHVVEDVHQVSFWSVLGTFDTICLHAFLQAYGAAPSERST